MRIDKTLVDNTWYYDLNRICELLDVIPARLKRYASTHPIDLFQDHWISQPSVLHFLKWLGDTTLKRAILKDRTRTYAQTHRWDIAYEQKYKCACCRELLHPSFEVDHVIPLFKGGADIRSNILAVCRNCHGKKSRRETRTEIHDQVPENAVVRSPFFAFEYSGGGARPADNNPVPHIVARHPDSHSEEAAPAPVRGHA